MTNRDDAHIALDLLAEHDPTNAATVGRFLEHLESRNNRLAQYAAAAGDVLEAGKRDLVRVGWVAAWMTLANDPDLIHDEPSAAFDAAFAALEGLHHA